MLPAALRSIYQQYKADTDLVASWLATTANGCGYSSAGSGSTAGPSSSANNPPAKSSRPKGKARKAKAAGPPTTFGAGPIVDPDLPPPAPTVNKKKQSANKTQYVLAIKDFEPMAAYIAGQEAVKVPDYFAVAIERVIWVRKTFSERLASSGAPGNVASDGRHGFFVSVLEKVRDLLKPLMEAGIFNTEQLEKTKKAAEKSEDPFTNMFGILGVYEPSEAFLSAPDVILPKDTEIKYAAEQEDSVLEALFALATLLNDYERLRTEIKSLWAEFKVGKSDLAAVSVATNAAFELARGMEDDILPILKKRGGEGQALQTYFSILCACSGLDSAPQQPGDPYNLEAYSVGQTCLINTTSVLDSYRVASSDQIVSNNYNGAFGWYDESLGAKGKTNRDKWTQDRTALMEILPDLNFLGIKLGRGLVEDELVRGVSHMIQGPPNQTPLWLAWAMQVYLDILQNLGIDCGKGFTEMEQESLRIKKSMLEVPASSNERNDVLRSAARWDTDQLKETRGFMESKTLSKPSQYPAFKFPRRHPMHCGLSIHDMRTAFHENGLQYAAVPGALMCTTQLYYALRQEKLLSEELAWDDIDTLRTMQGNGAFFVGDPPTGLQGHFKNYCLSIGTSISNWAPQRRQPSRFNVNEGNRRNLKFNGWVSLNMRQRLRPTDKRSPLSTDFIKDLLDAGRRHAFLDGKGNVQADLKEKARADKSDNTNLSPPALIRKLAAVIAAEKDEITFDYFTMHNICWSLLGEMKVEFTRICGPQFRRAIPREDMLGFVVGYVFSTAAGQTGLIDRAVARNDLLNASVKIVDKFLRSERRHQVKDMATQVVSRSEVADLKFEDRQMWGMDQMFREMRQMGQSMGESDRQWADNVEAQCRQQ